MALQFKTQSADTSYSVADVLGKLTLDELHATAYDMSAVLQQCTALVFERLLSA